MACIDGGYEVNLKACPNQIRLRAGLEGNTNYYWTVTNKFGQQWVREAVTLGSGEMVIPTLPFPAAMFNEHAGSFKLKVDDINRMPVKLFFNGNEYSHVVMTFQKIDDPSGNEHNIIY